MHASSFTYAVTRPYPYRWFTWIVIVGGLIFAVLFSALNLVANGYNLVNTYRTDYNGTVAERRWTSRFPFSLVEKSVANCQPQDLAVNAQVFTDKLSLPYTLVSVWQTRDGVTSILPSLRYVNNTLDDCVISFIGINLESAQRTAAQQGWRPWGAKAFAQMTCSIDNDVVPTYFNLTVGYEFVTQTIGTLAAYSFLQPKSNQTQASLWWAESLLSWYWLNLVQAMGDHSSFQNMQITQGFLSYTVSGNTSDISRLDFFSNPGYDFVFDNLDDDGNVLQLDQCCLNVAEANQSEGIGAWAAQNFEPNVWIQGDSFAKVFYATIMADMGQASANSSGSSIFSNGTLLEYFSANITQMTGFHGGVETQWLKAGPAREPYTAAKSVTGPLALSPSTIYTQYLCQIPELKSPGSLVIAVLLADLVFLQALWHLLNWLTTLWLERKNPSARYCEGCLRHLENTMELTHGTVETPTMLSPGPVQSGSATTTQYLALPKGVRRKPIGIESQYNSSFESREGLLDLDGHAYGRLD